MINYLFLYYVFFYTKIHQPTQYVKTNTIYFYKFKE